MLPAYLGIYLGDPISGRSRVARAIAVSSAVAVSFVVVFGLVGLVVGIASQAVVAVMPWIGLALGVTLIAAGGFALAEWFPARLGDRDWPTTLAGRLPAPGSRRMERSASAMRSRRSAARCRCSAPSWRAPSLWRAA